MRIRLVGGRIVTAGVLSAALLAPDLSSARLAAVGAQSIGPTSSVQTSAPVSQDILRPFLVSEDVPCPPQSHIPVALKKVRPHRKPVRRHVVRHAVVRVKPPVAPRMVARPRPHPHRAHHRRRPVVAAQVAKPVATRCEVLHPDWLKAMTPVTYDRVILMPVSYETPEVLALPIFYPTPDTRVLGASPFATATLPFGGGPETGGGGGSPPTTTPTPPVVTPPAPPGVPPVSSAPEPSIWLQMFAAVGLAGEALRRRRRARAA